MCLSYLSRLSLCLGLLAGVQGDKVVDFQQCDRQCRFAYGFYDRTITGVRVGALGHADSLGRHCRCSKAGQPLGDAQPHSSLKPWDSEDFWCGSFNSSKVCVLNPGLDVPSTMQLGDALAAGRTVLHCGQCAACSSLHDMAVLNSTKTFITTKMTKCAADFAKPGLLGGNQDLSVLEACLQEAGIDFSTDGRAWAAPRNQPTCMQCWTDNIMCDAVNCKTNPDCIKKFFNANNSGAFAGCLECDEKQCGPEFIRCAGSNRRSSGIVSDIQRPGDQVCKYGYYYNKQPAKASVKLPAKAEGADYAIE